MMNLRASCSYLKTVKPSSFFPEPKVFSSIVSIKKKQKMLDIDYEEFSKLITILFTQKKKTVRSVLFNLLKRQAKHNRIIEKKSLDDIPFLERRIFSLAIDELVKLYSSLKNTLGENLWSNMISLNIK